jgi:predicted RNA-binding Zn ribbon-like protein
VIFSHDIERSLLRVVALVNSAYDGPDDAVRDAAALADFVKNEAVSDVVVRHDDVVAVRRLRDRVRQVFDAGSDRDAATVVNELVSGAQVAPRLTNHGGHGWHMHYSPQEATLAERLGVDGGMALAQVIAAGERDRIRGCAAPGCARVLVDLSRNRSKRYCDARTCGNRLHVAAYRERRRRCAVGSIG